MLSEMLKRIEKTNEQRAKMACTLVAIMKHSDHASIQLRSTIAATFIEMLETSMIDEDSDLIDLINDGINSVAEDAKEHGVDDLREQLSMTVKKAKRMAEEHFERVNAGNDILSKVNFNNDINLN